MYLILFRGRPAVGKSRISDTFAKKYSLIVIRKDDIINNLSRFIRYKEKVSKAVYETFFSILCSQKNKGIVVAEFPFNSNREFKIFLRKIDSSRIKIISFLVICSDIKLWKKRFKKWKEIERPHMRIKTFEEIEKRYKKLFIKPLPKDIILDSSQPIELNIEKIVKSLPKNIRPLSYCL